MWRSGPVVGLPLLFVLLATACTMPDPPEPATGTFEWTTFENSAVGFELEVPDSYRPDVESGVHAVLFRSDTGVPVKVYWTTEAESRSRGLWFGEAPLGPTILAGREGLLYEYVHCDGPLCSRMKSYVIPFRSRHLALEFRSGGELHEVNRRILESFQVREPGRG